MAATPYTIDRIKSMVLTGSYYKQLTGAQSQLTNYQNRLAQMQANIATLTAQMRALQIEVLASLSPPVVVTNESIAMVVNNDGTVTLTVS